MTLPNLKSIFYKIFLSETPKLPSHGVMPEEGVVGNQYRVNVRLRLDAALFDTEKDDLSSTISYAEVFDILSKVMSKRVALLETVAVKFANEVRSRWPNVRNGWIEIIKIVPPIHNMIGEAGVRYDF